MYDGTVTGSSPAALSVLTLRETARPPTTGTGYRRRGERVPRLRQPPPHLDLLVDGVPLQRLLVELPVPEPGTYGFGDTFDLVSVADLAHPGYAAGDLRRLAGELPPDDELWPLEPGRLPLYVCPIDGDLACGAVTVAVHHDATTTTWSGFRLQNGYSDDELGLDLSALGPFVFARDAHRDVLLRAADDLDALEAEDRAAEEAHRREHGPRGRWRRLTGR